MKRCVPKVGFTAARYALLYPTCYINMLWIHCITVFEYYIYSSSYKILHVGKSIIVSVGKVDKRRET